VRHEESSGEAASRSLSGAAPASREVASRTYQEAEMNPDIVDLCDRLDNDFKYHPPSANQQEFYNRFRSEARALAYLVVQNVPAGREQSLALTKIEEAVMWANAGVARSGVAGETVPAGVLPS
jgi:hypothetical protein